MSRALRTLAFNAEYFLTVVGKESTTCQGSMHAADVLAEALGMEGVEHIADLQANLEDMYTIAVTEKVIAPGDPLTMKFKGLKGGGYEAWVVAN